MDIRDIKEVVVLPENPLEEMFRLQKVLIDHYVGIEGLPHYPIDINTKTSQVLIKDFNGRIIEELGEAWESYRIMMVMMHRGKPNEELIPHLQNFNEEISDALHFWLELMIFSGYELDTINDWFKFQGNTLADLLKRAETINNLSLNFKKFPAYNVIMDKDLSDEFLRGGRWLSKEIMGVAATMLWDITYYLQIARNTLKNKPWKQSEMLTDQNQYEENMKLATMALIRFMSFMGFTDLSIYTIYFKKNLVNQFRIRSKY